MRLFLTFIGHLLVDIFLWYPVDIAVYVLCH